VKYYVFKLIMRARMHYNLPFEGTKFNKKLSCRRETTRCFVSLNILPSHSRSLKIIRN